MQPPLEGVIPALLTAFDEREEIRFDVQRDLVRKLLSEGVQGLFVCGTSGEFPFLSLEEREKLTDLVAAEASGRAAIIVHVGASRPRDAIRLAQHAARLGVSAVSSIPPCYYHYRPDAVLRYLTEVAESTDLPFIYYHIPERTGFSIDDRFIEKLLEVPNLRGLKHSHADLGFLQRIAAMAGPDLRLFCGSDELFLPSLVAGACGAIGSTYNFLAPLFVPLWRAFRAGKLKESQDLQTRVLRILTAMAPYPGIAASKEAARVLGIDLGRPRAPGDALSPVESARLRAEVLAAGLGTLLVDGARERERE
ncbi:MAG TPA: dihydrodipicolinate synthase family protein [Planctomycetota bacterium]|nr:dihydrodipicolinate synthase family protein [Planctomycetota bacterium]